MTWIRVLAPSRREKGQAFELLMRQVLDACGLSPLRTRLKVSGAGPLLDIRVRHRKDATPYLGECCALSREVALDEVKRFFRRYRRERRKTKRLRGLFLSCTPFHPRALAWYHALGDEVRQDLALLGPDAITARLVEDHRLLDEKSTDAAVTALSSFPTGPRWIAFLGGSFYWVQTVSTPRRPTAYFILEGLGGTATRPICQEIKRLDATLRDKRLLDPKLRERTLLALLAQEPSTADELAQAVEEQPQEVLGLLQGLEKEGVVTSQRTPRKSHRLDRYRVHRGFQNFLHLARQFLPGAHRFRFLASRFALQMITTGLASHVEERFRLKLPAEDLEAIVNLLSISPAALSYTLSSARQYVVSDRELEAKFIPNGEREKLREAARARFVSDLSLWAITDSLHEEFSTLLAARGVRAYLARIQLKASLLQHPLFSLRGSHLHTLAGEKPPPEAELSLEFGAVMRLMQEYDHAIQYLNQAIHELRDPARLKSAWNNKGLCFFNKRRYQEAIECFNEAIKLDSDLKQAWFNKAICLREVGDTLGAIRCVQRSLEIDPAYKEAKDLLHRLQP
ncbi:MAG: tetratricopeptide repeat protein [Candidatus Methylomirabilales bacterium]